MPGAFPQPEPEPFEPTALDIGVVKVMLSKGLNFPPEIVDIIVDHADYWACTTVSLDFRGADVVRIRGKGSSQGQEDKLMLRTPPIGFSQAAVADMQSWRAAEPRFEPEHSELPPDHFRSLLKVPPTLEHPVRKIVWKIRSRDQGWGGSTSDHNTYRGSWTWFEAGLERFEADSQNEEALPSPPFEADTLNSIYPVAESTTIDMRGVAHHRFPLAPHPQYTVQRNRTASRNMQDYEVVWSWTDSIDSKSLDGERIDERGRGAASGNGEFVRSLKLGDVVTLWGKARFMSWANNVESASVSVYWTL